jgi:dihydrodipicolinate synthase/N-acetylneuraminate lyase
MAYSADISGFTAQLEGARRAAGRVPVWAGIGAYRLSADQTVESIHAARRLGAAGVVLFSYDSMIAAAADGEMLSEIGRRWGPD